MIISGVVGVTCYGVVSIGSANIVFFSCPIVYYGLQCSSTANIHPHRGRACSCCRWCSCARTYLLERYLLHPRYGTNWLSARNAPPRTHQVLCSLGIYRLQHAQRTQRDARVQTIIDPWPRNCTSLHSRQLKSRGLEPN